MGEDGRGNMLMKTSSLHGLRAKRDLRRQGDTSKYEKLRICLLWMVPETIVQKLPFEAALFPVPLTICWGLDLLFRGE